MRMTIYGECVGALSRTPVTISALAKQECELRPSATAGFIEGLLDLWIGAMGPFPVIAEHRDGRFHARFSEPLDARIIAHFADD